MDMAKPLMLLNTARDHYRLGKFEDAMRYAEEGRKELDEVLGVFYSARDQLVELSKAIKFAEDLGADVSSVRRVLADAKKAFESKEYDRTAEIAKQGLGDARKSAYDKTMDTIDATDKAFKLGKSLGADMAETEGLLQRALASLSKEDMPESVKLAKSGLDAANSSCGAVRAGGNRRLLQPDRSDLDRQRGQRDRVRGGAEGPGRRRLQTFVPGEGEPGRLHRPGLSVLRQGYRGEDVLQGVLLSLVWGAPGDGSGPQGGWIPVGY